MGGLLGSALLATARGIDDLIILFVISLAIIFWGGRHGWGVAVADGDGRF